MINAGIQQLLDRQEINDLLISYCRAVDRLDIGLFRSIFWEDGGYSSGTGNFISAGAKDFAEQMLNDILKSTYAITQHCVSNLRFEFESPTVASTEIYLRAFHRTYPTRASLEAAIGAVRSKEMGVTDGQEFDVHFGGRYLDKLEKRNGVWKIKDRRLVVDWTSTASASEWGKDILLYTAIGWIGDRCPADPSYKR